MWATQQQRRQLEAPTQPLALLFPEQEACQGCPAQVAAQQLAPLLPEKKARQGCPAQVAAQQLAPLLLQEVRQGCPAQVAAQQLDAGGGTAARRRGLLNLK